MRLRENVEVLEELKALAKEKGVGEDVVFVPSFTQTQKNLLLTASICVLYTPEVRRFSYSICILKCVPFPVFLPLLSRAVPFSATFRRELAADSVSSTPGVRPFPSLTHQLHFGILFLGFCSSSSALSVSPAYFDDVDSDGDRICARLPPDMSALFHFCLNVCVLKRRFSPSNFVHFS